MVQLLIGLFTIVIFTTPFVLGGIYFALANTPLEKIVGISIFPIVYGLSFIILCGALSIPWHSGIVAGKFPRQLTHPLYFKRRMYGLFWTTIYYFKPLYFIILTIPILKKVTFRLFGYKHTMNFVTYPDTWIRDLPLLHLGEGAYLSNRATIGTNICLLNGTILVDKISVGDGSIVGHLAMLAPGVVIGNKSEIGVNCGLGIRTNIGNNVNIGPQTTISHGVKIESDCTIGMASYIGLRAFIKSGIKIPSGANIPPGAKIYNKEDVEKQTQSETLSLKNTMMSAISSLRDIQDSPFLETMNNASSSKAMV